jgi:hypothetical protein
MKKTLMQTTSLTTRNTEIENIHDAAKESAGFEKLLKFKKGLYFIGEEEVPHGTEYLAHTAAWTKCWIKFVDGEVADRKVYRVALGEKPLVREDLDDRNEDDWPKVDGDPADPWVYQYLLPLENVKTGEVIIFVTQSYGGKRAIAELCDAYAKRTKKTGCGQPIIKLAKTDFWSKKYNTNVLRPLFEVVDWDDREVTGDMEVIPPATSEDDYKDEMIPY